MTKEEALALIDIHKNTLVNPVEMLHWTWLRLIVLHVGDEAWELACVEAAEVASR